MPEDELKQLGASLIPVCDSLPNQKLSGFRKQGKY